MESDKARLADNDMTPATEDLASPPPAYEASSQSRNVEQAMQYPGVNQQFSIASPHHGLSNPQFSPVVASPVYNSSTTIVSAQPVVAVTQVPNIHVPDELGFSIFTTLCCCLYLGIPAIILASQANGLRYVDPHRALAKAKTARALNITATVLGLIGVVIVLVLQFGVGIGMRSY